MDILNRIPFIANYRSLKRHVRELQGEVCNLKELQHRNASEHIREFAEVTALCLNLNTRIETSSAYGVNPAIHPDDFIYLFVLNHAEFKNNSKSAINYYFSTGAKSAQNLVALKQKVGIKNRVSLLEFAAGYGCVTRHLIKHSEDFEITSCDIHQQALDFIEQTIKAPCIGSDVIPENFKAPKTYGIVFALSFFSHLPKKTWGRWLAALYQAVESDGYLIFTTHGLISQREMISHAIVGEDGFWFDASSEQHDLSAAEYGTAISTEDFVRREIAKLDSAKVILFFEGYWWGHQDVWVVQKTSSLPIDVRTF